MSASRVHFKSQKRPTIKNYSFRGESKAQEKDFSSAELLLNFVQGLCEHVLAHPIANSTYSHGIFMINLPKQVLCSYKWLSLFLLESK
jgi:hypothetical protein